MSRTDDILDKTKRKEPEAKKLVVVVGIIVSVFVAYFGFGFYLYGCGVWDVVDSKPTVHRFDFYDEMKNMNHEGKVVYFIGDSTVGHAMYPREINLILRQQGYSNVTTYNLVENGDRIIRRVVEIQNIIDTNPDLVYLGVTYNFRGGLADDRTILVHNQLDVRDDSLYLFSDSEKEVFTTYPDFIFLKTYLDSAKTGNYWGSGEFWNYYDMDYNSIKVTSDDLNGDFSSLSRGVSNKDALIKEVSAKTGAWFPIVTSEMNRDKEALLYFVNTLQNEGIEVVLINMPLHPLVSERITDGSRQNFYDLLNQTGAVWYDFERAYDDDFFQDSHHASKYGGMIFAPVMADLIIQELS